jgi:hypothetical protein
VALARPHFLITGCARSGTGYTASLFSELGVPCGHEAVFTPYSTGFEGWGTAQGESSWLAVPFVEQLPAGTVVLHQVRHPAAVIGSLLAIGFFSERGSRSGRDWRSRWQVARARGVRSIVSRLATKEGRARARRKRSDFVDFLRGHCPAVMAEPDEWSRAARYWVDWNRAAARAADRTDLVYVTYRVEDLDTRQAEKLLALVGAAVDDAAVAAAVRRLPSDTNTRPRAGAPPRAERSLRGVAGMEDLAATYGYEL